MAESDIRSDIIRQNTSASCRSHGRQCTAVSWAGHVDDRTKKKKSMTPNEGSDVRLITQKQPLNVHQLCHYIAWSR